MIKDLFTPVDTTLDVVEAMADMAQETTAAANTKPCTTCWGGSCCTNPITG